jgi:hypothetical protein
MGKNATKRKKEMPVLFPEFNDNKEVKPKEIVIGASVKIGKPSNKYFQYIYKSLDFFNLKLSDLNKLIPLEGTKAKVTGMIQMESGDEIAIISKKNGNPFFTECNRLFIDRTKALSFKEILIVE